MEEISQNTVPYGVAMTVQVTTVRSYSADKSALDTITALGDDHKERAVDRLRRDPRCAKVTARRHGDDVVVTVWERGL